MRRFRGSMTSYTTWPAFSGWVRRSGRAIMNSFDALARNHTDLNDEDLMHIQRLMTSWGMLSDLCFADLLLFAPVAGSDGSRFVVLGQARPTTSQTFHLDVLVGRIVDEFERPMIARAWRRNE